MEAHCCLCVANWTSSTGVSWKTCVQSLHEIFFGFIPSSRQRWDVPRYPSGDSELIVQTSKFKLINNKPFIVEATKLSFCITRFMINQEIKIRARCFMSAIPVTNFAFGLLLFLHFCLPLVSIRILGIKIPSEILVMSPKHRALNARTKQNVTLNWLHCCINFWKRYMMYRFSRLCLLRALFCAVTLRSLICKYQWIGGTVCLHFHDQIFASFSSEIMQILNKLRPVSVKPEILLFLFLIIPAHNYNNTEVCRDVIRPIPFQYFRTTFHSYYFTRSAIQY
jgi:hypothetical protein